MHGLTATAEVFSTKTDTTENAKSFEFARKLSQYQPAGLDGARIKTLFNDGQVAMVINGPWFMAELRDGLNYGVHILPIMSETGRRSAPFVTAEGIFMANEEGNLSNGISSKES